MRFTAIIFFLIQLAAPLYGEEIKVGALLHLTGDFAMQGEAMRKGMELATWEINSAGGIGGKNLKVIYEDTKLLVPSTITATKRLLLDREISSILVSTFTEAKPIASILEKEKIPSICLWDSSPQLEDAGEYLFGIGVWTPASGELAAQHAYRVLGKRRAGIVINESDWGTEIAAAFRASFTKFGGEVLFEESLASTDLDFRSMLAKLRQRKVDVLYAPIGYNMPAFFKQLSEVHFDGAVIETDCLSDEIIQQIGAPTEGIYQTQSDAPHFPETGAMETLYEKHFGEKPTLSLFHAWGYDGVKLVAEAIRAVGTDRDAIKRWLAAVKGYRGASGEITMSPGGSSRTSIGIYRVEKGKLVRK